MLLKRKVLISKLIETKKPLKIIKIKRGFVLGTGLEPVRTNVHWILSPTCLPIPPPERGNF